MKDMTETVTAFEHIMTMTYVQNLIEIEKNRIQAKKVGNGIKSVDSSIDENKRIDDVVEKVVEAVERKIEEPIPQPPKSFKRK